VDGVTVLIVSAIMLSRDPNFSGILHWDQRNPSNAAAIERRFGAGTLATICAHGSSSCLRSTAHKHVSAPNAVRGCRVPFVATPPRSPMSTGLSSG